MRDFGDMDYTEYYMDFLRNRITELRMARGISEREMSLSMGKGPSYINQITLGKSAPQFESFFEICEYFDITPEEFFHVDGNPVVERELLETLYTSCNGHPERFLRVLKKIKPEHFSAFVSMLEDL